MFTADGFCTIAKYQRFKKYRQSNGDWQWLARRLTTTRSLQLWPPRRCPWACHATKWWMRGAHRQAISAQVNRSLSHVFLVRGVLLRPYVPPCAGHWCWLSWHADVSTAAATGHVSNVSLALCFADCCRQPYSSRDWSGPKERNRHNHGPPQAAIVTWQSRHGVAKSSAIIRSSVVP